MISKASENALAGEHINYKRYFATPTPLNSILWYVVAETDSGFYTTYRSAFDNTKKFDFTFFPKHQELLEPFENEKDAEQLIRFSQGYYTLEQKTDTIIFNDLRFGQIAGWTDPKAAFVFHYYLNYPKANLMVIQRGRFSNWNRQTFRSMIQRMKGN
jgi:inner membrane protein